MWPMATNLLCVDGAVTAHECVMFPAEFLAGRSTMGAAPEWRWSMRRMGLIALVLAWMMVACTSAPSGGSPPSGAPSRGTETLAAAPAATSQPQRVMVMATRVEPKTIAARGLGQNTGVALYLTKRVFNADLALLDDQGRPRPYLADSLPQLNTDSWKVNADGTMETTYYLRPNLVWHDGQPLTADDFVFAFQVYARPDLGTGSSPPINLIQDVVAPDPQTVLIHWKQPYSSAGSLQSIGTGANGLPPLPRHILGATFDSGSADGLLNHPYWSTGFVGLGPYKLDHWEPGAYLEMSAFDHHALGVPKIQRLKMIFTPDGNSALAGMLAGDITLAADNALPPQQAATFLQQVPSGTVVSFANQWRAAHFQARPELASPAALMD